MQVQPDTCPITALSQNDVSRERCQSAHRAGWLGDRLGPSTVFLLAGMVMVVLNIIPMFLRDIRELK